MTLEIQKKLQDKFFTACESGSLKLIKYFLETPGLAKHIDVGANNFEAIRKPFLNLDVELIDYFLSKAQEKDFKNISQIINKEFEYACRCSNLDKLHFIHGTENYKKYLDLTNEKTNCFRIAYENRDIGVLNFLILHVGLTRDNDDIVHIMRYQYNSPETAKLFKMTIDIFNKQKLPTILEEKLSQKEYKPFKPKMKI